jgi:DNA-binding MarR family transcriptional regulator
MQHYVESMNHVPARQRQSELLDRIIARPAQHARLLNTFSRMEYVGVRKMLKSRRSEHLDLDGLQHMLDETIHALRLKKAALALAGDPEAVVTYAAADTLAGDAGEAYLQAVDHAALAALSDCSEEQRAQLNYLLSSAAIEVRAEAFYPLYEERLRAHGVPVSVAAILRDEDRHLQEMAERLEATLPNWRPRLEAVLDAEASFFSAFLEALEAALAVAPAA